MGQKIRYSKKHKILKTSSKKTECSKAIKNLFTYWTWQPLWYYEILGPTETLQETNVQKLKMKYMKEDKRSKVTSNICIFLYNLIQKSISMSFYCILTYNL